MPYKILKRSGRRPYKIINIDKKKIVGTSTSRAKAEASVRIREASHQR